MEAGHIFPAPEYNSIKITSFYLELATCSRLNPLLSSETPKSSESMSSHILSKTQLKCKSGNLLKL